MRAAMLALLSVGISIGHVAEAQAASVQTRRLHSEGSFVDSTSCSFPISVSFSDTRVITDFFDEDGALVRALVHTRFIATGTNDLSSVSITDDKSFTVMIDLIERTRTINGTGFNVTLPGEGMELLAAGRLVLDFSGNVLFEGGPHQSRELFGPLVCEALG